MPEYMITSPEGVKYKITAPEGASQEQLIDFAQRNAPKQTQEITEPEKPSFREATFLENMGRGMMDVYQGTAQLTAHTGEFLRDNPKMATVIKGLPGMGAFASAAEAASTAGEAVGFTADKIDKEIASELAIYNKNNPGFKWGRLAGGLATPLILFPAAGQTLPARMALGSVAGAAGGVTQPAPEGDYWETKGEQALTGAVIGAAVPVVGKVAQKIFGKEGFFHELIKPLFGKGIYSDVRKFLRETITENRPKIENAIRQSIARGEKKTVGEIIAEATRGSGEDFGGMIVRLERDLQKESDALKSIFQLQSKTWRNALNKIAGSEDDLANAVANRATNAAENYAKANAIKVKPDQELLTILNNKFGKEAKRAADAVAEVEGTTILSNPTRYLHLIKEALDEQLERTGDTALKRESLKAVLKVKDNLTSWLADKNKLYENARYQFQQDSVPINRMQVGQYLKDKFIDALDKDSPSAFVRALRDAKGTIKRADGFERYKTLDKILPKEDIDTLNQVAKGLRDKVQREKMATASKAVIGDVSREVNVTLPHILSRPVVMANHALKLLGQDKTPEYKKLLVDLVQNPEKFLKAYKLPSTNKKAQYAMDIVRKLEEIGASQEANREISTLETQ